MQLNLQPLDGVFAAQVFENALAPRDVYFSISIPLAPFTFENEEVDTMVGLDFIRFPTTWRSLAGNTYTFPINPTPGFVDGSLYLDNVHNPVDVSRIKFGRFTESSVDVDLDIQIDFTYEGPSHLGKPKATWSVKLTFDASAMDTALREYQGRS